MASISWRRNAVMDDNRRDSGKAERESTPSLPEEGRADFINASRYLLLAGSDKKGASDTEVCQKAITKTEV